MLTTKLLGFGLSYLKQPRVIAEILAGILLGASSHSPTHPSISPPLLGLTHLPTYT